MKLFTRKTGQENKSSEQVFKQALNKDELLHLKGGKFAGIVVD